MLQAEEQGGIFKSKNPFLADTVSEIILDAAPRTKIVDARFEPIVGSVKLALDELYRGTISEGVNEAVNRTAGACGLLRKPFEV